MKWNLKIQWFSRSLIFQAIRISRCFAENSPEVHFCKTASNVYLDVKKKWKVELLELLLYVWQEAVIHRRNYFGRNTIARYLSKFWTLSTISISRIWSSFGHVRHVPTGFIFNRSSSWFEFFWTTWHHSSLLSVRIIMNRNEMSTHKKWIT